MSAALRPGSSLLEATMPPERRGIARDAVRMLVTSRATGAHTHAHFYEIAALLQPGDLLVVNDSATLPAALSARRASGESIALHVSTAIDSRIFMVEPRGTVLGGEELHLPQGGSAVTIAPVDPEHPRLWYAWFQLPLPMPEYLTQFGAPIRYGYVAEHFPLSDYQTIFATNPGSSEMPSAARPFTLRVTDALHRQGVQMTSITLHCGVSSFEAPERPSSERYIVSAAAASEVNAAKREGRRVIAVGTTVLRALESAHYDGNTVAAAGWTDLVIDERRGVKSVDGLLTGFHDAAATHQWILRAFLKADVLAQAYALAAQAGYYQHEFGDVHLIV